MVDSSVALRRIGPEDAPILVSILADAFDADPFFRWMFGPEQTEFRRGLRAWLDLVVEMALRRGEGSIAGADEGAVIWLAPSVELVGPEELAAVGRLLDELVGSRAGDIVNAIGSGASAVPDTPHWLCLYIGVRPGAQGSGLGRALLQPGLDAADSDGRPVHLVSTNPATSSFYERFGFRVLAEVTAAIDVPTLRPMWREPVAPCG